MWREYLSTYFYRFVELFSRILYIEIRKGIKTMLKIYQNIKELRIANNWTQEELAKKMGYTDRSTIAKIEAGKVDITQTKIIEFANVFGVEAGDLLGWGDDMYVTTLPTTPEENKAKELYSLYEKASPEVQSAVELLLKSSQPSAGSQEKT